MQKPEYKIGLGYDIHRLVPNRKLVLGGINIKFNKGLKGHSDADVLVHAICDAILGSIGKNDIGEHFPDTDLKYKNISSLILLDKCLKILKKEKYKISNIDCIVFAQKPKLTKYKKKIRKRLSLALKIDPYLVNIKAKTMEKLGFIGKKKAIAAQCTLLVKYCKK